MVNIACEKLLFDVDNEIQKLNVTQASFARELFWSKPQILLNVHFFASSRIVETVNHFPAIHVDLILC